MSILRSQLIRREMNNTSRLLARYGQNMFMHIALYLSATSVNGHELTRMASSLFALCQFGKLYPCSARK